MSRDASSTTPLRAASHNAIKHGQNGKDAQLHHHWEEIPTENMSHLILVYSVMANEAITKVWFLFLAARDGCWVGVGSAVHQTQVRLKSKIQAVPVPGAPQPALPWSCTAARSWGCHWVPQHDGTVLDSSSKWSLPVSLRTQDLPQPVFYHHHLFLACFQHHVRKI